MVSAKPRDRPRPPWHAPLSRQLAKVRPGATTAAICAAACLAIFAPSAGVGIGHALSRGANAVSPPAAAALIQNLVPVAQDRDGGDAHHDRGPGGR